jgi:hypothetical protein
MYKQETNFVFRNANDWKVSYLKDFETESEFNSWMNERLSEGLVYIGEEAKKIEIYPQVLRLDLKSPGNSYFTLIERFESKEDYINYCNYKLLEGFKVIGSSPYLKEKENAKN